MAKQVVSPRVRGFVCITAHPEGCAAHVREQIAYVKSRPAMKNGPKNVLVIGSSTGYGLASRISAAFGAGANTFGVYFERPSANGKPASAGWYNTAAFEAEAKKAGLYAASANGDAFSAEMKAQVIERLKKEMPQIDLVVYSLAAPRRTDPATGEVYKSVLKPVGAPYSSKNLDTDKKVVNEVTLEPATEDEIKATVKVMGGEDWKLWIEALDAAGLLAEGCQSVAYSYIGPSVTWPIYKDGSIGQAKKDLYAKAEEIDALLKIKRGRAFVSVNKAVVTQASSAIPVVPLYISVLFKVMKAKGLHEDCIEQIQRLFETQMYNDGCLNFDDQGLVRIDDWEMREDVQKEVFEIWPKVSTENLLELTDFVGYQQGFLKLFGFGLPGVDYAAETELEVPIG
ncbi:MAG TPA: trans-2-enoyl-CoA reductase family protein [Candidatus Spyradosoma merdigallinarum]|uniref:Enoyl-[acyl-carrier-protein] reductase [NADH] n=1 Tax=Candidatus Spyradosoma merdigallinarum TaxID=2840950 RepID=A0A9D1NKQ6_9BACT|nr:trans-2-enoyl-CoA reductase family protein [Candidatus Spyradosoma merdigallinarum]